MQNDVSFYLKVDRDPLSPEVIRQGGEPSGELGFGFYLVAEAEVSDPGNGAGSGGTRTQCVTAPVESQSWPLSKRVPPSQTLYVRPCRGAIASSGHPVATARTRQSHTIPSQP